MLYFHFDLQFKVYLLFWFLNLQACNVKWLGLRGDDLELINAESLLPLKPKDLQIANSLISSDILQVINHPLSRDPKTFFFFCCWQNMIFKLKFIAEELQRRAGIDGSKWAES